MINFRCILYYVESSREKRNINALMCSTKWAQLPSLPMSSVSPCTFDYQMKARKKVIVCDVVLGFPYAKCTQSLSIQYTPFSSNDGVENPSFSWKAWPQYTVMATFHPAVWIKLDKFYCR